MIGGTSDAERVDVRRLRCLVVARSCVDEANGRVRRGGDIPLAMDLVVKSWVLQILKTLCCRWNEVLAFEKGWRSEALLPPLSVMGLNRSCGLLFWTVDVEMWIL